MENIRNCDAEMESMILMSEVANSLGLPTFEAPPISEVVFGILFKPLDKLLTPHLGVFWQEIKNSYPIIQEAPMLAPAIEPKGPQVPNQTISTDLFHSTFPRVWFLEENGNSLMQLQRDRFLHNWRKISESQIYPRYGSIKQIFEERFSHFSNFITKNSLGSITPLQFELTYVNTIDSKSGWTGPESIGSILNDFSWNSKDRFLPIPEAIHWRTALPLPDKQGRLHVILRDATTVDGNDPVLIMELTARGISPNSNISELSEWLDLAHEWIVKGFVDLTTTSVQEKFWKRIR